VLARVRIIVPDRPGSLGRVASAIGVAGADIVKVDVLDSESGRAVDDVFVQVRDRRHLDAVRDGLASVLGISVVGVQHPAPPVGGHADLELLRQVVGNRSRGLRTFLDGAPGAFGADWAAIVSFDEQGEPDRVVATSVSCPGADRVVLRSALRLGAVRMTPPGATEPYGGTALVPLDGRSAMVLVRQDGPDFHRDELWRLDQVVALVGTLTDTSADLPTD
jgi:hypothetical protein